MMKNIAFVAFCAAGLMFASCGSEETADASTEETQENSEQEPEKATYSLDATASTLSWKGSEGEDEYHVGTIRFSDGNMTMEGDQLLNGSFTVDMGSMAVTDEGMPDKLKGKLKGHLENEDFFNVPQFPSTQVTLNGYADGKLDITLTVLGQKVPASVPVNIALTEDQATLSGDFSVDFSTLGMPGMAKEEGDEESISPEIEFSINAVLKKG
jgi:polyisoprenoid-binding protein YceI